MCSFDSLINEVLFVSFYYYVNGGDFSYGYRVEEESVLDFLYLLVGMFVLFYECKFWNYLFYLFVGSILYLDLEWYEENFGLVVILINWFMNWWWICIFCVVVYNWGKFYNIWMDDDVFVKFLFKNLIFIYYFGDVVCVYLWYYFVFWLYFICDFFMVVIDCFYFVNVVYVS